MPPHDGKENDCAFFLYGCVYFKPITNHIDLLKMENMLNNSPKEQNSLLKKVLGCSFLFTLMPKTLPHNCVIFNPILPKKFRLFLIDMFVNVDFFL